MASSKYFELASQALLIKLAQIKCYITKHNPTIGVLTEELIREFLKENLPKVVSIEQGFIINQIGEISKQCDIIIYDSQYFSPLYRVNDVVIIPAESVIAVIEVKTSITKKIFHQAIDYFQQLQYLPNGRTYLFIFNSGTINKVATYLHSYNLRNEYTLFDHDTFQFLPDEITGIDSSFHLRKDLVVTDADMMGYSSWFFKDHEGTDINALQFFLMSIKEQVNAYIKTNYKTTAFLSSSFYEDKTLITILAIPLFQL